MKKTYLISTLLLTALLISCKEKKPESPFEANPIAKAIKLETQQITKEQLDRIPESYRVKVENGGTIEHITYTSKNYYGDKSPNEKKANVNSNEFIESIAREKLDMYLPNERVYVDNEK